MHRRSKVLVMVLVVAFAVILGSVVLATYAIGNEDGSNRPTSQWLANLTDEQREAIEQKVQEMREDEANREEIRAEINAMLEEWGVEVPEFLGPHAHRFRDGRHRGMLEFLTHSESVELEGTAVVLFKDMLVVDTAEGQIQIHLSRAWTVNGELTMRGDLFEGGYLSEGEDVTIQALRADVVHKEGLNIYFLLGYEIVDDTGVPAFAVLPFNIETST